MCICVAFDASPPRKHAHPDAQPATRLGVSLTQRRALHQHASHNTTTSNKSNATSSSNKANHTSNSNRSQAHIRREGTDLVRDGSRPPVSKRLDMVAPVASELERDPDATLCRREPRVDTTQERDGHRRTSVCIGANTTQETQTSAR